jgi:CubicO group peptidase (beta-lactamase class C family)
MTKTLFYRLSLRTLFLLLVTMETGSGQSITPDSLNHVISRLFSLHLTPGMQVAVVRGNEVIFARGYGYADNEAQRPVTEETLFYIASTTKSLTGFAAALLDYEGKMRLSDPLSRFFPGLVLHSPLRADSISILSLLTHTHGIENEGPVEFRTAYSGEFTRELLLHLLSHHPPSKTGRAFSYGNLGYVVAGLAMEEATHRTWQEIVDERVLQPAGMVSTFSHVHDLATEKLAIPYEAEDGGFRRLRFGKSDANMHAAGGHVSTARDMARWLIIHLNAGSIDGRQIFPPEVVATTDRQWAIQDRNFGVIHRYGWGLGWDLGTFYGDTLLHRFGSFSGFRSHVSFMPAKGLGVVVLVNESTVGAALADLVAASLYDLLLQKPSAPDSLKAGMARLQERARNRMAQLVEEKKRRAARPQQLLLPLAACAGAFENEDLGRMTWRVVGGSLEVTMGVAWSGAEIYDGPAQKFRVELTGSGEVVTFLHEGNLVTGLKYAGREFQRVGE